MHYLRASLDRLPTKTDPVVDLANTQSLFKHGTMEERKRVVRAFVVGLTIDAASQRGEIRMKKLPAPDVPGTGSSFNLVAGARYEVQKRTSGRNLEVVRVRFRVRGGTLVPIRS